MLTGMREDLDLEVSASDPVRAARPTARQGALTILARVPSGGNMTRRPDRTKTTVAGTAVACGPAGAGRAERVGSRVDQPPTATARDTVPAARSGTSRRSTSRGPAARVPRRGQRLWRPGRRAA